jgi:excisionase family DNA binding protein
MRTTVRLKMYPVSEACKILGVSYPALKQWIYKRKIKTVKTPGGHYRIPESEINRLLPAVPHAIRSSTNARHLARLADETNWWGEWSTCVLRA